MLKLDNTVHALIKVYISCHEIALWLVGVGSCRDEPHGRTSFSLKAVLYVLYSNEPLLMIPIVQPGELVIELQQVGICILRSYYY